MAERELLALIQTAAIIYLVYRVHRLERLVGSQARSVRRGTGGDGGRKVIPLLREQIPPGPFQGTSTPPPSDPKS